MSDRLWMDVLDAVRAYQDYQEARSALPYEQRRTLREPLIERRGDIHEAGAKWRDAGYPMPPEAPPIETITFKADHPMRRVVNGVTEDFAEDEAYHFEHTNNNRRHEATITVAGFEIRMTPLIDVLGRRWR